MKEKLRNDYRYLRANIINKDLKDNIIFSKVISNKKVICSDTILIYASNNEEVSTIKLIEYFLKIKKVGVPRIENDVMNFYYIKSIDELKKGYFGLLEPITNDKVEVFDNTVSITPGICFSKDLYRIGYGKGFYDRFYDKYDIYSIGLCYSDCLVNYIPNDKYDRKVNEIITD